MSEEFKLSYTANEIDEKLGKIPDKEIATVEQIEDKANSVHTHGIDWTNEDTADDGYIANKPNIKKGQGENAVVIGTGDAQGAYSIAGGTNDKDLIKDLAGSGLLSLVTNIEQSKAIGAMSLAFGAGNKALTAGTGIIGINSTAGSKGFYWHSFDFTNNIIKLSTVQKPYYTTTILGITTEWNKTPTWTADAGNVLANWAVNDVISIVNDTKHVLCSKITAIDTAAGTITVDVLPFTESKVTGESILKLNFDDCTVINPSKPTHGIIDQGLGAFTIGLENKAVGSFSHVEGWNNTGAGDFSHVEGRDNKAAYAAHAEGADNAAVGYGSHAEGASTTASGTASHAEGNHTVASNTFAHAEGARTTASGSGAHAEGADTTAEGKNSHAEGTVTTASGTASHAEGADTTASNYGSHAEGASTTASGSASHAEGNKTTASGSNTHAEGFSTTASSYTAHAEGASTTASGIAAHSEGDTTIAKGKGSHSEGVGTDALGEGSHAEGKDTVAYGIHSHAEGFGTAIALDDIDTTSAATVETAWSANSFAMAYGKASHTEGMNNLTSGDYSHTEGINTCAINSASHAEGQNTIAYGIHSHAEGTGEHVQLNIINTAPAEVVESRWRVHHFAMAYGKASHVEGEGNLASGSPSHAEGLKTIASGEASHAEGFDTEASGNYSHAEGSSTKASGEKSHAEGSSTKASGEDSHAEGFDTEASGNCSHTEGSSTKASGSNAHAEGEVTKASGGASHAEGGHTEASGFYSHAEGSATAASGYSSHAEGYYTKASGDYQHVQGKYNIEDTIDQYAHIVGNGTGTSLSNAYTLDWQGNAWFAGTVSSNGADYAELFEWQDGNINDEDRIGLLVTLDSEKIKLANSGDEILGIISGTAAILGDNYECEWNGKYLTDDFGRIIYGMVEEFMDVEKITHEEVEKEVIDEETGETRIEIVTEEVITTEKKSLGFFKHPRLNPDYDPSKAYVNRSNRPEWDNVGMLGKLYVRDDGKCQVNGYATVGENGIATASLEKTNMRVLSRVNENVIRVLLK